MAGARWLSSGAQLRPPTPLRPFGGKILRVVGARIQPSSGLLLAAIEAVGASSAPAQRALRLMREPSYVRATEKDDFALCELLTSCVRAGKQEQLEALAVWAARDARAMPAQVLAEMSVQLVNAHMAAGGKMTPAQISATDAIATAMVEIAGAAKARKLEVDSLDLKSLCRVAAFSRHGAASPLFVAALYGRLRIQAEELSTSELIEAAEGIAGGVRTHKFAHAAGTHAFGSTHVDTSRTGRAHVDPVALCRVAGALATRTLEPTQAVRCADAFWNLRAYHRPLMLHLASQAEPGLAYMPPFLLRSLAASFAGLGVRVPSLFEAMVAPIREHAASGKVGGSELMRIFLAMAIHRVGVWDKEQQQLVCDLWPLLCETPTRSNLELTHHRMVTALLTMKGSAALPFELASIRRSLAKNSKDLQAPAAQSRGDSVALLSELLSRHGWSHTTELFVLGGSTVLDMAVPDSKVALEYDGPWHYLVWLRHAAHADVAFETAVVEKKPSQCVSRGYGEWGEENSERYPVRRHDGLTEARSKLLGASGWHLVRLPWSVFDKARASAALLDEFGAHLAERLLTLGRGGRSSEQMRAGRRKGVRE